MTLDAMKKIVEEQEAARSIGLFLQWGAHGLVQTGYKGGIEMWTHIIDFHSADGIPLRQANILKDGCWVCMGGVVSHAGKTSIFLLLLKPSTRSSFHIMWILTIAVVFSGHIQSAPAQELPIRYPQEQQCRLAGAQLYKDLHELGHVSRWYCREVQ